MISRQPILLPVVILIFHWLIFLINAGTLRSGYLTQSSDEIQESKNLEKCDFNNSLEAFFAAEPSSNGSMARELCHEYFKWRLQTEPEYSTMIGVYEFDDQLDSYSQESFLNKKVRCENFSSRADELLNDDLNSDEKFKLIMMKDQIKNFIDGIPYKGNVFPLTYLDGIHLSLPSTIQIMQFNCEADYQKLLSRLRKIPKQIDDIIEAMKQGISEGLVFHRLSLEGVPKQIKRLIVEPEQSSFYVPFINATKESIQSEGLAVISGSVIPAFKKLQDFITDEYLNSVRPNIGASSLPNGSDFYQQCLNFHLSTHMTPKEVHNLGLNEVMRIERNMEKVKEQSGFQGSLHDFFENLRQNKDSYFDNKEDLINGYKNLVHTVIRPKLAKYFSVLPPLRMDILEVPDIQANSPSAYHTKRSFDGKHLGAFWVNTHFLNQRPRYEMASFSLHEAEPGHELQGVIALEETHLMRFQQFVNDVVYHSVPTTFSMYTAFNEGWALYCEYLGEEMGMYENPKDLFGRYSQEIFRACRLVVDTGIHAFNWTFDDAVNYMLNHTAASRKNIENEVRRYITWPGQACSYKIGELKIKELRQKAEKQLGSDFDLRKFHDACLKNGNVPLTLLEMTVEDYINNNLSD